MPVVEAAAPSHELEFSANTALTTDYVFRGFTQSDEGPAIQGGFDASYNIFYVGTWASSVDFTDGSADVEIDYYAGMTPSYAGLDFDIAFLYYTYPGADDAAGEYDYWELMGGVSKTFMDDALTLGFTTYYTSEYFGELGENWAFEGSAGYTFDKVSIFTPTLSGLIGYSDGDDDLNIDYTYWNVGLSLGFYKDDMFTLDLRYWDTDVSECAEVCDSRFVGTLSAAF